VLSAVIASIFGVKGTIVGVAIGSVAATTGSAFLFQSLEKTHDAVKQVVVRVPDRPSLLRRLGGTRAAGVTESEPPASTLTDEAASGTAAAGAAVDSGAPEGTTFHSNAAATTDTTTTDAATATLGELTVPVAAGARPERERPHLRWQVVAGAVILVFVLSLLVITAGELIAGRPLADLFGVHTGGGTSVERIFQSPPPTLPPPTSTTTTSTSTSTTTTAPASTTTSGVESTTTSTGVGSTSTTTVVPSTTSPGVPAASVPLTNPG
jgi:hypothetical protein